MQLRQSRFQRQSWDWELSLDAQSELGKVQRVPPGSTSSPTHLQQGSPWARQWHKSRRIAARRARSHEQVQGTGKLLFAGLLRRISQPPKAEAKAKAAQRFFSDGIFSTRKSTRAPARLPALEAAPNLSLQPWQWDRQTHTQLHRRFLPALLLRPTGQHGALVDLYAQRPKRFLQSLCSLPPLWMFFSQTSSLRQIFGVQQAFLIEGTS